MEPICPVKETKNVDSGRPKWDEVLDFDLKLRDIPRAAKLCMGLCFISKRQARKQQVRRNQAQLTNTMKVYTNDSTTGLYLLAFQ